jgi:hypothetical protein
MLVVNELERIDVAVLRAVNDFPIRFATAVCGLQLNRRFPHCGVSGHSLWN